MTDPALKAAVERGSDAEFKVRLDHHLALAVRQGEIDRKQGGDGKSPLIVTSLLHLAQDAIRALADTRAALSVMEAMAKGLEAIRDLDTRDHHDGYDDGPGGGNFVYRDVIFTDEAFPLIDTALSQYRTLGGE